MSFKLLQYKSIYIKILILLSTAFSLIIYTNCSDRITRIESESGTINQHPELSESPFIKLHMKNGDIYVLENWQVENKENLIKGKGSYLDLNRSLIDSGDFKVPVKQVVLAETNIISGSSGSPILAAVTVVTGIVGIICATNPKACFGSCPTFYFNDGNDYIVQAEGFSSSILPGLEETDIDALFRINPKGRNLEIQLRNEAYETHVIREANIIAVPRENGTRVLAAENGNFFETKNFLDASEIRGEEGDCSEKLCAYDGIERFSAADSNNLADKEFIELSFNNLTGGNKGLVIASRQTLMPTFLFYQTLAYMGKSAGDWFATFEKNPTLAKEILNQPKQVISGIEITAEVNNRIIKETKVMAEQGPIASDIKVIPLSNVQDGANLKVKLKLTKGLWRLDYIALVDLVKTVEPITIYPSEVFPKFTKDKCNVKLALTNKDSVLITYPGDKYFLNYILPKDFENYELFMQSKGYYLEWLRQEWLAEEDPSKVYQMLFNSKQFFKDLAPEFKKIEADMEESFWSSKYVY